MTGFFLNTAHGWLTVILSFVHYVMHIIQLTVFYFCAAHIRIVLCSVAFCQFVRINGLLYIDLKFMCTFGNFSVIRLRHSRPYRLWNNKLTGFFDTRFISLIAETLLMKRLLSLPCAKWIYVSARAGIKRVKAQQLKRDRTLNRT